MQVRLLTAVAGPDGAWSEGDVYTCDEGTAQRMIASGYAVPLSIGSLPVEVAMASGGPERMVKPRARARR